MIHALAVAAIAVAFTGLIMLTGWAALRYEHRHQERKRHDPDDL
jgi:hypothetical protein